MRSLFFFTLLKHNKMRKILFLLLFVPVASFAQITEFGFFSLSGVMDSLPECKTAQDNYNALLERCDSEIARGEEELTRCYVSFLEGQNSFPEPILRKRQKELQDMVDRSVLLRDQLKEWLAQAHDSLFNPIVEKIDKAVERVCIHNNLAYAIDTDKAAYRYVNPKFGADITNLIIKEINSPTIIVNTTIDAGGPVEAEAVEPSSSTIEIVTEE